MVHGTVLWTGFIAQGALVHGNSKRGWDPLAKERGRGLEQMTGGALPISFLLPPRFAERGRREGAGGSGVVAAPTRWAVGVAGEVSERVPAGTGTP